MPRFFDDYSNTYLTHDSAAGRKQQRRGWKFRENFKVCLNDVCVNFVTVVLVLRLFITSSCCFVMRISTSHQDYSLLCDHIHATASLREVSGGMEIRTDGFGAGPAGLP